MHKDFAIVNIKSVIVVICLIVLSLSSASLGQNRLQVLLMRVTYVDVADVRTWRIRATLSSNAQDVGDAELLEDGSVWSGCLWAKKQVW